MELAKLTLYEQMVLLALDDKQGNIICADYYLQYTVSGAILLELMMAKCISLEEKTNLIHYTQPYFGSSTILHEAIDLINTADKPKNINHWLETFKNKIKNIHHRIIEGLIAKDILEEKDGKFLFFKYKTYPTHDPLVEHILKEKVRYIVLNKDSSDFNLVLVARLAKACELFRVIFRPEELSKATKYVDRLDLAFGVDTVVKTSIDAITTCIVMCTMAATMAATSAAT